MSDFPGPDFENVKLPFNMGDRELFPDGRLQLFKHKSELKSCGKIYYEKKFHGPPVSVHGGAQAYILDEIMGCTGWMHDLPVVAKKIEVQFLKPTPIETQLYIYGEVISKDEPYLIVKAKMCDVDGVVYSQSQGEFRILSKEAIQNMT